MISDFPVLSNFGIAIVLSTGIALITLFVLLPAIALALTRRGYPLAESVETVGLSGSPADD